MRKQAALDSGMVWCLQVALKRTTELELKSLNATKKMIIAMYSIDCLGGKNKNITSIA